MKINKLDFLNILLFLISPLFSLPTILYSFLKITDKYHVLYSLLIAYISSSYIPEPIYDKVRHFELYELVKNMSFNEFIEYISIEHVDFLFYYLLFLGGGIGFSFHFVVFFVTFITVFLIFKIYRYYISKNNPSCKWKILLISMLSIVSITYLDIFSGMRFTLSMAIVFYSFFLYLKGNIKLGFIFSVLSCFTHFSTIVFLIVYLFLPLINKLHISYIKYLFVFSVSFFLIPLDFFNLLISYVPAGPVLMYKINTYILESSSYQRTMDSIASYFVYYLNYVWIYTANIYLIFRLFFYKGVMYDNVLKLILFIFMIMNFFSLFPTIFLRYSFLLKMFLFIFLLSDIKNNKLIFPIVFLFLWFLVCFNQLVAMRYGLSPIFDFNINNIILPFKMFFGYFDMSLITDSN